MKKVWLLVAALAAVSGSVGATERAAFASGFAPGFVSHSVLAGGRTFYYRIGGSGPAVLLLHGYGDTGQMWAALAPVLAMKHTVIVPDLPGLGNSRPEDPAATYDMASVARSLHALMQRLRVRREAVVGHDIGLILAYSYAAQYRSEVTKLALLDGPIPGVGPWQSVLLLPGTWHFDFYGPHAERLTAGRERIYFDGLWDRFAFHPERISDAERNAISASYAQRGNMRVGFTYFEEFDTDAVEDAAFAKTRLGMPVLAIGGLKSFASLMPAVTDAVAANVRTVVIPDSGHWLMDENPAATIRALAEFLD